MMTQMSIPSYVDPRTGYLSSRNPLNEETIQGFLEQALLSFGYPFTKHRERDFLSLADQFLTQGGNPNLIFPSFAIGDNTYRGPTFFHIVYLSWKYDDNWDQKINALFERLIDRILTDSRTNVKSKFTEDSLCDCEHFFDHQKKKYNYQEIEEGYLLEQMTIAHYAMAIGDLVMVDKVLQIAPDLLQSTCCFTKGKGLLSYEIMQVADLTKDASERSWDDYYHFGFDETHAEFYENRALLENLDYGDLATGELALATQSIKLTEGMTYPVIRTIKVTLFHLAARLGNEMACGFLRAKEANPFAVDSDRRRPFDYLEVSLSEGFIQKTKTTKQLRALLEPIARLSRRYLPSTFCILHREGYTVCYDTRSKIPIFVHECLTKESLQKKRVHDRSTFRVDQEVPKLNRAKHDDYSKTGYDRGHMAPAADAVASDKAMEETFLLSNVCPQQPGLNRKYWKEFEKLVRNQVKYYDLVEVFTGGLFLPQRCSDGKSRVTFEVIGNGNVAVPTHLYKVLYFHNHTTICEAYILPNVDIRPQTPLTKFKVTLNRVQELSGILFNEWRS